MKFSRRLVASLAALVAFSAAAADITGDWTATVATADGQRGYTFAFRQAGATLIGTTRSECRQMMYFTMNLEMLFCSRIVIPLKRQ